MPATAARRRVRRAGAGGPSAPRARAAPRRVARPSSRWRSAALFAGLLLAGALFHVWSRLHVVDVGYRLAAARAAHAHLLEQNRRLSLELAALESPARLAEAARRRLGLVQPAPAQIVHLRAAAARSGLAR